MTAVYSMRMSPSSRIGAAGALPRIRISPLRTVLGGVPAWPQSLPSEYLAPGPAGCVSTVNHLLTIYFRLPGMSVTSSFGARSSVEGSNSCGNESRTSRWRRISNGASGCGRKSSEKIRPIQKRRSSLAWSSLAYGRSARSALVPSVSRALHRCARRKTPTSNSETHVRGPWGFTNEPEGNAG